MLLGAFCATCALALGQLAIGPAIVTDPGRTIPITQNGVEIGWYVDNEEPLQASLVAEHIIQGWGTVVAGIWPACESHPDQSCGFPGAINAREFYPFGLGETVSQLPTASSYIVQWSFAWPGSPPPTKAQRWKLLCAARARRPQLILLYQAESVPTNAKLKATCSHIYP